MFNFNKRRTIRQAHTPTDALIAVFEETKLFLNWPENDFSSSRWASGAVAVAEIELLLNQLRSGQHPQALRLELIFAPSGPMQEVSLQSGWEIAFFQLADRFDQAIYDYKSQYRAEAIPLLQSGLIPA